jgi:hypothetical protein
MFRIAQHQVISSKYEVLSVLDLLLIPFYLPLAGDRRETA